MAVAIDTLDRIHIRDLHLRCVIGVDDEERREKQDLSINITMYVDLRSAGHSDRIEDTVDYEAMQERVIAMGERSQCRLIEHLADRIADICLSEPRVQRAIVTVDKPGALRFARSVAVEIVRDRPTNA